MSDWSKQAAQHFRERERLEKKREEEENEKNLIRDHKISGDRDILKHRAPEMWDDLCRRFESSCAEFNSAIGKTVLIFRRLDENQIEISKESSTEIKSRLLFNPKTYTIDFRVLGLGVTGIPRLGIKVQPGASEPSFSDNLSSIKDPAKIVEEFLDSLLS